MKATKVAINNVLLKNKYSLHNLSWTQFHPVVLAIANVDQSSARIEVAVRAGNVPTWVTR